MIKIEVLIKDKNWKKYLSNPNRYLNTQAKKINLKKYFRSKLINISILLTGNYDIRLLNKKFRKKNKTTDVLSFPIQIKDKKKLYVGDIAISFEIIQKRSKETNFFLEFDKMWVHGYLHLIGYQHGKLDDFKKMLKKEKLILKLFHKVN